MNNHDKLKAQNFFSDKPTLSQIQYALARMCPDLNGNLHATDYRSFWLGGKHLGSNVLVVGGA